MLKKPTSRRKTATPQIVLNLVPMLDAMVVLIAFLLFTMSFLAIVGIESPAPIASPKDLEEKIKEKPLQLTLSLLADHAEIWSPFGRIPMTKVPHTPEGAPDVFKIHQNLVAIKQKFIQETKLVLVPFPALSYEVLVAIMDSVRYLEQTDPVLYVVNKQTGVNQEDNRLFPEIIFGNLMGGQ